MNTEKNGVGGINIEKFPPLLRDKLKDGQIQFPENTQFEYMPILGYRMIMREDCNDIRVTREDFRSHAELGILVRGVRPEDIPEYYGASVYKDKKKLANIFKLPKPGKILARGHVVQAGGPQSTNEKTKHVCWWVYEDVDVSDFKVEG